MLMFFFRGTWYYWVLFFLLVAAYPISMRHNKKKDEAHLNAMFAQRAREADYQRLLDEEFERKVAEGHASMERRAQQEREQAEKEKTSEPSGGG